MSTCALSVFENDEAADWLSDFLSGTDLGMVKLALEVANVDSDDYLEAPEARVALAALEVLAATMGRPGPAVLENEELMGWLQEYSVRPGPRLLELGLTVLHRVQADNSELSELREASDDGDEWREELRELDSRLAN